MLNGRSNIMYGFLDKVVNNKEKTKHASRKSKSTETVASARLQRFRDMRKQLSEL